MAGGRVWGEGARARVSACAYHNMCYTNDKKEGRTPVHYSIKKKGEQAAEGPGRGKRGG